MKDTPSKKGAKSPFTKIRPPRVYRTKTGRPYIKHKGKKVYLNFGKKTNDMSDISILKLFLKYLRTKKRDVKNKPTKAQVIYPDTDRIELENRQRVDSQVRNYLRDKYEKINEMDRAEEKKRKEAKELADERRRAAEAKQRQDTADAAERAADINRAIAREQALQRELQADRRATQNIRAQIQAAPQLQIQAQPQAQPPPQIQPPPPPQGQPDTPPPQPQAPPPPMAKTKEQKESEEKQMAENIDLLKSAGYSDKDIKRMPRTALKTTAAGIRSYEAQGLAIEEYKTKLDAEKAEKELAAKALEDKNKIVNVIGGLSRRVDTTIKTRDLADALRRKLTSIGEKKLGKERTQVWIAKMVVRYNIDVGDDPTKMKRKIAEYAGLKVEEGKTEQEGKGYNTLAGMINKKYTADQIKKYLDKAKSKTKKAELVDMLINKMNTNRAVDKKISEELDIDTVEDEGGTYEERASKPGQIGRGVDSTESRLSRSERGGPPLQGLTTTQIDGLMSDEKRYIGTVASDEIKTLKPKGAKYAFIMNTDKASKPGQHWIAVFISGKDDKTVEVYDPLGTYEPTKEFLEQIKTLVDKMHLDHYLLLKVNKIKNHSDTSDTCGWFAVKFLKERFLGNRFKFSTGFTQLKEDEIQRYKKQNGYGFDTYL